MVVAEYKSEVQAAAHQAQAIWTFLPVREVVSMDPLSGGLLLGEDDLRQLGLGLQDPWLKGVQPFLSQRQFNVS